MKHTDYVVQVSTNDRQVLSIPASLELTCTKQRTVANQLYFAADFEEFLASTPNYFPITSSVLN